MRGFTGLRRAIRKMPVAEAAACSAGEGGVTGTLGRNAGGKGEGPFEKLATCLALIEIVNSCNLACPTCYADSRVGAGGKKWMPCRSKI